MAARKEEPPLVEQAIEILSRELRIDTAAAAALSFARDLAPAAGGVARDKQRGLAIGLAALLGRKIVDAHGAFWFPQRELLLGGVGFPHALIALDPLALVDDAVAGGDVAALDARLDELAGALARAGGGAAAAGGAPALTPADYAELFDPAFVQFLVVDERVVAKALALPLEGAAEAIAAAVDGAAALEPQARESLERALVEPLDRRVRAMRETGPATTLGGVDDRVAEIAVRMASAVAAGSAAEEGFFADVVFRLLPLRPAGERVLGVFAKARELTPVRPARLFAVDAADLVAAAGANGAVDRARAVNALAGARLDEALALARRAQEGAGLALAFRRLTASEVAGEAGTAAVAAALAEISRGW